MGQFLVGRQPIVDESLSVHGYELRSRGFGASSSDDGSSGAELLVRSGLDFGIERLVGDKLAYVEASRRFVLGELPTNLAPEKTVVHIPLEVGRDVDVVEGCRRLVRDGFRLALGDRHFEEADTPLLELARTMKIDVAAAAETEEVVSKLDICSKFGLCPLAEGVESSLQLQSWRALGFRLFQGNLLSHPGDVAGSGLAPSHLACLRLISKLWQDDVSAQDLAEIIETDPALSYRILRAASTGPLGGVRRELGSVREGVVMLGTQRIRNWANVILLGDSHGGAEEQFWIAMVRAKMAELLAEELDPALCDAAFTAGLLSALDLLLAVSLQEVLEHLTLSSQLVDAVLGRVGELGGLLTDVIAWELGDREMGQLEARSDGDLLLLQNCYVDALVWVREMCAECWGDSRAA